MKGRQSVSSGTFRVRNRPTKIDFSLPRGRQWHTRVNQFHLRNRASQKLSQRSQQNLAIFQTDSESIAHPDSLHISLLEDELAKKISQTWMLGLFDFEGLHAYEYQKGVLTAITDRLTGIFESGQITEFEHLTDLNALEEVKPELFGPLLALAERLYGIQNLKVHQPDMWLLLPGPLERADFANLRSRLSRLSCKLDHRLEALLWRIERMTRVDPDELTRDYEYYHETVGTKKISARMGTVNRIKLVS